jgi:hypothetical protein
MNRPKLTDEKRDELIARRRKEFSAANPGWPDFSHHRCSCGHDTVSDYGEDYPTATITGCRNCHRSWCD